MTVGLQWLHNRFRHGTAAVADMNRTVTEVWDSQRRVNSQQVIDRCHHFSRGDRTVRRPGGMFVGAADNNAPLCAAAEEQRETALRPVVAPGLAVDLGRTPHLAHDHHQCLVEQVSLFQIPHERISQLVQNRQLGT